MLASRQAENPDRICSTRTAAARSGSSVTGDGPCMACLEGKSFPLGATLVPGGANFSVFAKHSTASAAAAVRRRGRPEAVSGHRSRPAGQPHLPLLARLSCPASPPARSMPTASPGRSIRSGGCVSTSNKVLLDPYGKCIARPAGRSREAARHPGDNAATALKSVVVDPSTYDWEGDDASRPALCQDDHLRDACRRVHPTSELRRRVRRSAAPTPD